MSRIHKTGWRALFITLVLGAPLAAQESPLAVIPASSPVVIQIHGLERTKDRMMAMVNNAVPNYAKTIESRLEEGLTNGLEGRKLNGLANDGPIFLAFAEIPTTKKDDPKAALVLRVTKYEELRDSFLKPAELKTLKAESGYETFTDAAKKQVYLVNRDGYAVVTEDKELAIQYAKKDPGLDTKMNKDLAKRFLDADVAVYVDMETVNAKYGDHIKAVRQLTETLMQQARTIGAGGIDKNTLEMVKNLYVGIFQLSEDCRSFLLAFDFRRQGLAIHSEIQVGADTKTNSYLKSSKLYPLKQIASLPTGQLGYSAVGFDSGLMKALRPYLQGMMSGPGEKPSRAMQDALELLEQAGPESYYNDFNIPVQGLSVWNYKDAAKAVQGLRKMYEAIRPGETIQSAMIRGKPVFGKQPRKYKDFSFTHVVLYWDFERMLGNNPLGPAMVEPMKKMIGEGMSIWFGTDGKVLLQIVANDWTTAERHLDAYVSAKNTIGKEKSFLEARQQLPAEASMLSFIDIPYYAQVMGEFAEPLIKSQGVGANFTMPKARKGSSYLGFALTVVPENASADIFIPNSTVVEIRRMVESAMKNFPGL